MTDDDETSVGPEASRRSVLRAAGVAGLGGPLREAASADTASSEPTVGECQPNEEDGSPPPGPAVLYDDPVTAPQFENTGAWNADPLLVCGAQAYDGGEFLYQDWVYDDYGANTSEQDTPPQPPTSTTLDKPVGDVVYPTDDDRYRDNAADLLEFRCRPVDGGVAYRVTLNTMVEEDAAAVAIGIDEGNASGSDWGHGLGDLGAAVDHVLVVAGEGHATLDGSGDGIRSVEVDPARNQIEVVVALDPGRETWTHYCVSGVHDGSGGFAPVQDEADQDNPGGAHGESPPPVFNVAFRGGQEPLVDDSQFTVAYSWRDKAQADALAARDISAFGTEVDFATLQRRVTDRRQADPEQLEGMVNRLFSSRVSIGGQTTYEPNEEGVEDDGADAVLTGHVQPYSVYVPSSYDPSDPGPLHVLPHSLGQNYNQYAGTENQLRQLGEQRNALVLMFEGRGPAGWWHDEAEYDLFEAWADFRARYEYDEDRVTLGGYSMGGYATYRLAGLYPDLFARGFETVGPPDESIFGGPTNEHVESEHNTLDLADNLRHVPLLMWHGSNDELVPLPGPTNYHRRLRANGYRHRFEVFPGYDHFTFFFLDEWGPGREFLEGATVTRNPARVTYRSKPITGNERFGLTYEGAYWLSGIRVADPESDDGGLVDATSYGDGYAAPVTEHFSGTGTKPSAHIERGTRWQRRLRESRPRNALDLELTDVAAVTVWVEEAGLDADREIELTVSTNVRTTVQLATETHVRPVEFPPGDHTVSVTVCGDSGNDTSGDSDRATAPVDTDDVGAGDAVSTSVPDASLPD